jgi:hypothetical protein
VAEDKAGISSGFHSEVLSSTVSAQAGEGFRLRRAKFCRRVSTAKTLERSTLAERRFCGDAGGSLAISRVNCQGHSETRASANRLPGHCGLLHFPLLERVGRWPSQRRRRSDSQNRRSAACTGKSGTHFGERCRTGTVGSPLPSGGRAGREFHERCGSGWLAWGRIDFWGVFWSSPTQLRFALPQYLKAFDR